MFLVHISPLCLPFGSIAREISQYNALHNIGLNHGCDPKRTATNISDYRYFLNRVKDNENANLKMEAGGGQQTSDGEAD